MNDEQTRIGILTLTQSENYGTVLQAYATHQLLNSDPGGIQYPLVPTDVHQVRRRRLISLANPKNPSSGITRVRNFASMRNFIRPFTDTVGGRSWVDINNRQDTIDYLDSRFTGFITGSDEIWNLAFVGDRSIYYIPPTMGMIRASFATSANRLDISKLSKATRDTLRTSLDSYSYISVRDTNTRTFVQELLSRTIPIDEIVDPTIIYGLPEFVRPHAASPNNQRKRILMMVRDRSVGERLLSHFRNTTEIDTVFVRYPGTRFIRLDPGKFVGAFGNYDCVITDFFHGTCMSVLSKAPFVSFDSEALYSQYESKIKNLLTKLGLEDRYVNLAAKPLEPNVSSLFQSVDRMLTAPPPWTADAAMQRERKNGMAAVARIRATIGEGLASAR